MMSKDKHIINLFKNLRNLFANMEIRTGDPLFGIPTELSDSMHRQTKSWHFDKLQRQNIGVAMLEQSL